MDKRVRPFSTGYFMINARVLDHTGDEIIMPREFYGELRQYNSEPLLKVRNSHYWPRPEKTVPSDTIAIPDTVEAEGAPSILLAKEETTRRLVDTGEQARPT